MVFCGQCGFHLPSGITRCPRCGTVAAPDTSVDAFSTEAPTVESLLYSNTQNPPQAGVSSHAPYPSAPSTPPEPQKLVLRAGSGNDYNLPGDNEPTSALNAAAYRTHTPTDFQTSTPSGYSDYADQSCTSGYNLSERRIRCAEQSLKYATRRIYCSCLSNSTTKETKKGKCCSFACCLVRFALSTWRCDIFAHRTLTHF